MVADRPLRFFARILLAVATGFGATGALAQDNPPHGPRLRVLGTAQDGGLPHAACTCDRCNAAREDPARRRFIASLALIVPPEPDASQSSSAVYLVDATPDIREQLDALQDVRQGPDHPQGRVDRKPVDGVLLTHAHIGHYLGLAFFGFEAVSTQDLPVHCTPKMAAYLERNGPWEQMVRTSNIDLKTHAPGASFQLDGVKITPVKVPHRDEYADTVGYRFEGSRRTILYIPDTEPWRTWLSPQSDPLDLFEGAEVLLIDGSFYSPDELPGRDVASIGHPLMTDTMALLQGRVDAGEVEVYFTHLNHSNPALEPGSDAASEVRRRGFHILTDGQAFDL
jgi:pyrroloquinoline quinone biosynthesis protein B